MKKWMKWLIVIVIGVGIALIPTPVKDGLDPNATKILGVFVATIVALMLQPATMGTISIISICVLVGTKLVPLGDALKGFSSTVTWLVAMAIFLARGFSKTGLGRRISLHLIKKLGHNTLTLGYAIAISDLVFGPVIPSYTSRSGGLIYPIIQGVCDVYDSKPGPTANRIGAYLMQLEHQVCVIVGSMFLTGSAVNPVAAKFVGEVAGFEVTWISWFAACIVPGLVYFAIMPFYLYKSFDPEIKKTPQATEMATNELQVMGPMSNHEKIQLGVFFGCLILWSTSQFTKLDATFIAFLAVAVLLITGVITWKDCLAESTAWDVLIWVGTLVTLAGFLTSFGLIDWFSSAVGPLVSGLPWVAAFFIIAAIYLWIHYFFASLTAHVMSLFTPFLLLMIQAGVPNKPAAYILCAFTTLVGALTHYASGHSPIFYGAGYVSQGKWWKTGFVASVMNYTIYTCVGLLWWKLIGLY